VSDEVVRGAVVRAQPRPATPARGGRRRGGGAAGGSPGRPPPRRPPHTDFGFSTVSKPYPAASAAARRALRTAA
jgi:hypothetical protein